MEKTYQLIFEKEVLHQLNKLHKKKDLTNLLNKMLDKIELLGPLAGNLISNQLSLYEVKMKKPPLRLYYQINEEKKQAYVLEFEMKTSQDKQKKTIDRLKKNIRD